MTEMDLPAQFAERFVAKWDKPDRYAVWLASTIEELQEFHDAMPPRIAEIRVFLDSKSLGDLSDADRLLGRLTLAWVSAAEAVDVFKQPRAPDSKMYWVVRAESDL